MPTSLLQISGGASESSPAPDAKRRRSLLLSALLIVFAGLAAYSNSFSGPFVFDDTLAITDNPTIRHLWPPWDALSPPAHGEPVTARPLLNLSFAINYAISGLQVGSYHTVNLLIHLLATLTLFFLLYRTFLRPALSAHYGSAALPLALVIALLWTVHPLQTESVTYLSQRAESLMGLFYLLTLYTFLRAAESSRPARWFTLSWLACLAGMAAKEVMATAPLLVFLYDRTFVAGSFRDAWRQRWRYYCALASTWLLLAWLVLAAGGDRGQSVGLGLGVTATAYALSQCSAIVHYLVLSIWPHPLIFDYGPAQDLPPAEVIGSVIFVALTIGGALYALWRRPALGFLGASFFLILLPSSSFVPVILQTTAEHRLYLPLAAILTLGVLAAFTLAGRCVLPFFGLLAGLFAVLTFQRNATYRDPVTLWADTAARRPDNPRAHFWLAHALVDSGRVPEGVEQYRLGLQLQPDSAEAHSNLGSALGQLGHAAQAIEQFQIAVKLRPDFFSAHFNLANAWSATNQPALAISEYQIALVIQPESALAQFNLANLFSDQRRFPEAAVHYTQAASLVPDFLQAQFNLGNTLLQLNRYADALPHYQQAVRLAPGDPYTHTGLANTYALLGRYTDAIPEYQTALRLQPNLAIARNNLAIAQAQMHAPPALSPAP
jgi:tetratricopeptide (TPR) repeat protein